MTSHVGLMILFALFVSVVFATLMTVAAEWSGVWAGVNDVRAVAGMPLGLAVAFVVARAAATLHYGECVPRRPIASNRPFTPI